MNSNQSIVLIPLSENQCLWPLYDHRIEMQRSKQQADTGALSPERKGLLSSVARLQRNHSSGLEVVPAGVQGCRWMEREQGNLRAEPATGRLPWRQHEVSL